MYNWQLKKWPQFEYDSTLYKSAMDSFFKLSGRSDGIITHLGSSDKIESLMTLLVKEAMKTSAIEGEMLSREDVMSSIKKNLGYTTSKKVSKDLRVLGIAEALTNSRISFHQKLSEKILFEWHKAVMLGTKNVNAGKWRSHSSPMQIVSGQIGKEKVHFEAPPSKNISSEMKKFIQWFNASEEKGKQAITNPLIRSAIAHLYFESIHPFEDGNGRIGRIIAEKVLSQHLQQPVLLSLSSIIEQDKKSYYSALKKAQQTLQIDNWIKYFSSVIIAAQNNFHETVSFTIKKSKFFDKTKKLMDVKQSKAINRMLQETENEFIGGMNAKKYQSITKASKATATRDLADLVQKKILIQIGAGRSTSYQVNLSL